jgi:conjugal transfer pilus assembly protein TraW
MANFLKYVCLLSSFSCSLSAKDYGVHDQTFPVEEEDLLAYIQTKASSLDTKQFQSHDRFQLPAPVDDLLEASTHSIHYFDPTIRANEEIKDAEGKIIIAKGASYNPLESFYLSQALLFFDGDNKEHIAWAKSKGDRTKWILVKENPFALEEENERSVFFDQHGILVKKLTITSIPSHVSQEGKRLKIESCPLKEGTCSS